MSLNQVTIDLVLARDESGYYDRYPHMAPRDLECLLAAVITRLEEVGVAARADERTKVLLSLGLHEDGGCIVNDGGTCVLARCARQ